MAFGLEVPTYVGVNRHSQYFMQNISGSPHIRGGEPKSRHRSSDKRSKSPHTWG